MQTVLVVLSIPCSPFHTPSLSLSRSLPPPPEREKERQNERALSLSSVTLVENNPPFNSRNYDSPLFSSGPSYTYTFRTLLSRRCRHNFLVLLIEVSFKHFPSFSSPFVVSYFTAFSLFRRQESCRRPQSRLSLSSSSSAFLGYHSHEFSHVLNLNVNSFLFKYKKAKHDITIYLFSVCNIVENKNIN